MTLFGWHVPENAWMAALFMLMGLLVLVGIAAAIRGSGDQ